MPARWATVALPPLVSIAVGLVAAPRPAALPDVTSGATTGSAAGAPAARDTSLVSRTRPTVPLQADIELGGEIAVLGADLPSKVLGPGDDLTMRFFFEAKRPLTRSWQIFLHVDSRAVGYRIHGDHFPLRGTYPTELWRVGEFITDEWTVTIPRGAPADTYDVWLGFYDGDERLPWTRGDVSRHDGNNRVRVGSLTIGR